MIESDRATLAGLVRESLSKEVTTALTVGDEKGPAGQRTGGGCVSAKALGQVLMGEGRSQVPAAVWERASGRDETGTLLRHTLQGMGSHGSFEVSLVAM